MITAAQGQPDSSKEMGDEAPPTQTCWDSALPSFTAVLRMLVPTLEEIKRGLGVGEGLYEYINPYVHMYGFIAVKGNIFGVLVILRQLKTKGPSHTALASLVWLVLKQHLNKSSHSLLYPLRDTSCLDEAGSNRGPAPTLRPSGPPH